MTLLLVSPGDKTTSGGEVISASSTIIEERNIALNGERAWCPKDSCSGPFQINGTAHYLAADNLCVITGDRVLCNCKKKGAGNTDAGESEEPQSNIGEMSFYQSQPTYPDPEPKQHAQVAKNKQTLPPPEATKK